MGVDGAGSANQGSDAVDFSHGDEEQQERPERATRHHDVTHVASDNPSAGQNSNDYRQNQNTAEHEQCHRSCLPI